jgi:hypothetical protein
MAENGLIEGVFYEVSLVADGMAPGEAKAVAALKRVEDQAQKTGAAVDRATGAATKAPTEGAGVRVYRELEAAFKAGSLSAEQFAKGAGYLGGQFKVLAAETIAAAAALNTEKAAAAGAAVATEVATVATGGLAVAVRGLLATLGPFFIAMLGIELITKLVRKAWDALGGAARERKKEIDDLTESLLRNREAARPEDVKAEARLKAARTNRDAAQDRVDELSALVAQARGSVALEVQTGKLTAARLDLAKKTKLVTEAERELGVVQTSDDASRARRLAGLVAEGVASQKNIADLKALGDAARKELVLLARAGAEGDAARQKLITVALGDPTAIEKRREQLAAILRDANREAERLAAEAAKKAKEGERAAGKEERHDESVQALIDRLATLKASLTSVADDNTLAMLKKIDDEIKNAKPDPAQLAQLRALRTEIADIANEKTAEKLGKQLRDLNAASLLSTVPTLTNALKDQLQAFKDLGATPEQIAKLEAIQQPMIDATARSEELSTALEKLNRDLALGFNLKFDLAAIQPLIDKAIEVRNAIAAKDAAAGTGVSKAQKQAQDDLDKLLALEVQLREKIKAIQLETLKHTETVREQTGRLAGDIADAANAAFGLASAFLGVDSNITKALGSIGQLAGGIQAVAKATSLIGALPGIGQIIGGGLALAGSLFGKDPAIEAARKETLAGMEKLKTALLELKDAYLQNVSTAAIKKDIADAEKIIAAVGIGPDGSLTFNGRPVLQPGEGNGPGRRGTLRDIGRAIGQDFDTGALLEYFKQLDAKYGTNLASFIERQDPYGLLTALRQIPAALKDELDKLGGFGNTAAGVIKKVAFEFEALGKTNAFDKFRATIKALKDAGIDLGEFGDQLAKLADPSTTAEEAAKIVEDIVTRLTSGTGINFGGLTPEEIRALITQGADARRTGDAPAAGTGGFNREVTITEVTGSRMSALLTTANVFAEATAGNTALIARLLGGTVNPGPVAPPPGVISYGGGPVNSVAGPSVSFGDINVTVAGPVADPQAAGAVIGEAVIREIDRRLGGRAAWARRAAGSIVLT